MPGRGGQRLVLHVGAMKSGTTFIQRVNTSGGLAPPTGCTAPADIGHQAFVPYTADYVFYAKR